MSNIRLMVFVICFFTLLTVFSVVFDTALTYTPISNFKPDTTNSNLEGSASWISNTFDSLSDIPIVNLFVPLLKLLTFQYAEVPTIINIFLDMITLIMSIAFFVAWKGGS